jgi:hypothetical protein
MHSFGDLVQDLKESAKYLRYAVKSQQESNGPSFVSSKRPQLASKMVDHELPIGEKQETMFPVDPPSSPASSCSSRTTSSSFGVSEKEADSVSILLISNIIT